ncbi:MAG: hypothetical protein RR540_02025 [Oscillospiraceae bacterium]
MLEIHQKADIIGYEKFIDKAKINPNEVKIVEAFDKGKVIGYGIFSYSEDTVKIFAVDYGDDKYLCDGIVRTILFKASMLFIDKAEFVFENLSLMEQLHFLEKGSNTLNSIKNVMDNCKSCKKS